MSAPVVTIISVCNGCISFWLVAITYNNYCIIFSETGKSLYVSKAEHIKTLSYSVIVIHEHYKMYTHTHIYIHTNGLLANKIM